MNGYTLEGKKSCRKIIALSLKKQCIVSLLRQTLRARRNIVVESGQDSEEDLFAQSPRIQSRRVDVARESDSARTLVMTCSLICSSYAVSIFPLGDSRVLLWLHPNKSGPAGKRRHLKVQVQTLAMYPERLETASERRSICAGGKVEYLLLVGGKHKARLDRLPFSPDQPAQLSRRRAAVSCAAILLPTLVPRAVSLHLHAA